MYGKCKTTYVLSKVGMALENMLMPKQTTNTIEEISINKRYAYFKIVIINLSLNFTWHLGISGLQLQTFDFSPLSF